MASITIRNLDDKLKQRLRVRAAQHGRSMEDEAREILRVTLAEERAAPEDLGLAIRRRFAPFGEVELPTVPCEPPGSNPRRAQADGALLAPDSCP